MIKANWKNSSGGLSAVFVLASVTPLIFAPPARAADYDIGSIHITQPWARATPKGASSGAEWQLDAYLRFRRGSELLELC
jgi:hypothetical protein